MATQTTITAHPVTETPVPLAAAPAALAFACGMILALRELDSRLHARTLRLANAAWAIAHRHRAYGRFADGYDFIADRIGARAYRRSVRRNGGAAR